MCSLTHTPKVSSLLQNQDSQGGTHVQVSPASSETNRFSLASPLSATPANIRGVASPDDPEVESNVTNERPNMSELYPEESDGSGAKVPICEGVQSIINDLISKVRLCRWDGVE